MRPLVLFLPALFLDSRSFEPVADFLGTDVEVDHVGFPIRPSLSSRDALRAFEDSAVRRIASAGDRTIVLVGNSLGAWVSARVLGGDRRKVHHFVALAGLAGLPAEVVAARNDVAGQVERGDLRTADVLAGFTVAALGSAPADERAREIVTSTLARVTQEELLWGLRMTESFHLAELRAEPTSTPVTAMHGRQDPVVPFACGEELVRQSKNARLIALDTDAHVLSLADPRGVADVIRGVLS